MKIYFCTAERQKFSKNPPLPPQAPAAAVTRGAHAGGKWAGLDRETSRRRSAATAD